MRHRTASARPLLPLLGGVPGTKLTLQTPTHSCGLTGAFAHMHGSGDMEGTCAVCAAWEWMDQHDVWGLVPMVPLTSCVSLVTDHDSPTRPRFNTKCSPRPTPHIFTGSRRERMVFLRAQVRPAVWAPRGKDLHGQAAEPCVRAVVGLCVAAAPSIPE